MRRAHVQTTVTTVLLAEKMDKAISFPIPLPKPNPI